MMELAEALDTTGVVRGEWKGKNWRELLEKQRGGERVFISGRGSGWVDEAGSDTIPDAAGGE
jgi:hypothetical protein